MLLSSPETLHVFLGQATALAISRSGWRGRLGQTRCYPLVAAPGEPWRALMAVFAEALKDFSCRRVRVVLSHHFVQYRVLSWRDDLVGDAEYLSLAQLEFSAAFGALAESWTIALSDESPGVARVASAVPTALLAGLGTVVDGAGARLLSVKPYLAVVPDDWGRHRSGNGCSGLLLHEPGRICVAVRQAGSWCWVRHLRVGEDWPAHLAGILQSEAQLAGLLLVPADVHVFAPGAGSHVWATLRSAGFRLLEPVSERGFVAGRDGAFAPAWLG